MAHNRENCQCSGSSVLEIDLDGKNGIGRQPPNDLVVVPSIQ